MKSEEPASKMDLLDVLYNYVTLRIICTGVLEKLGYCGIKHDGTQVGGGGTKKNFFLFSVQLNEELHKSALNFNIVK